MSISQKAASPLIDKAKKETIKLFPEYAVKTFGTIANYIRFQEN